MKKSSFKNTFSKLGVTGVAVLITLLSSCSHHPSKGESCSADQVCFASALAGDVKLVATFTKRDDYFCAKGHVQEKGRMLENGQRVYSWNMESGKHGEFEKVNQRSLASENEIEVVNITASMGYYQVHKRPFHHCQKEPFEYLQVKSEENDSMRPFEVSLKSPF
jgi:hypothetical protein